MSRVVLKFIISEFVLGEEKKFAELGQQPTTISLAVVLSFLTLFGLLASLKLTLVILDNRYQLVITALC